MKALDPDRPIREADINQSVVAGFPDLLMAFDKWRFVIFWIMSVEPYNCS